MTTVSRGSTEQLPRYSVLVSGLLSPIMAVLMSALVNAVLMRLSSGLKKKWLLRLSVSTIVMVIPFAVTLVFAIKDGRRSGLLLSVNFQPKVDSNPIATRVRRKRQRLPPNLLS